MHVVVNRSELHGAFQAVASVVAQRTTKPILQHVKMTVNGDSLTLEGTDLEVGIRHRVDGVTVKEPGEGVAPAARMGLILRETSDEQLEIRVDEHHCVVKATNSEYRMLSEDAADYPEVPGFDDEAETLKLPGDVLAGMIRRTVFATDVESTRYALNGVLFDVAPKSVTAVATDGRRMALVRQKAKAAEAVSGIVPSKALTLIERSVQDLEPKDTEVALAVRSNDLLVRTPKAVIFTRLVEGRFPKYDEVLPKEKANTAEVMVGELLSAVRRAAILTSEESRGVTFSFEAGNLVLTSRAAEYGESTISLPISYEGQPVAIIFNPQFLADALRVLPADLTVQLDLIDGDHASVLRAGDDYVYVLMPLAGQG